MFLVKDYCICCRDDKYGGSIELVEAGIDALKNEVTSTAYKDVPDFCSALEGYVDDILAVSTSVLPLINLMIRLLCFSKEHEQDADLSALKEKAVALLDHHAENQAKSTENLGLYGSRLIKDGCKFGTFSTSGSVMAALQYAVRDGKKISAVCFEARPHNEGYRTLREISELGIPTVLGVDALLCCLIPKCDIFMIGADAISATGEVFAKTGSYPAALVCKAFGIPFYVAADTSKFDSMSVYGFPLKDSLRPVEEVTAEEFPPQASVTNISFELIPPHLIQGVITEKGIVPPAALAGIAKADHISDYVIQKLSAWLNSDRAY